MTEQPASATNRAIEFVNVQKSMAQNGPLLASSDDNPSPDQEKHMRKVTLLGLALGVVALGMPGGAAANKQAGYGSNCDYATAGGNTGVGQTVAGNQVFVYTGTGSTGNAGTTAVGGCVNVPAGAGALEGGTAEIGTDAARGSYAVIDGNNANQAQGAGYMGLSNYEDGSPDPTPCNGNDSDGNGSNGGGCVGTKTTPAVNLPIPLIICGDTSGKDWNDTGRDGCFTP
jgi:hypothetical protein